MSLFTKAVNTQAFLKCGISGFAGAGKTYTASSIGIGLAQLIKATRVLFLDTETGSDWMRDRFAESKIELFTAKTRAFKDLLQAVDEAEKMRGILIVDSITHFWREICDSYLQKLKDNKKNRPRGLEFQDWAAVKKMWGVYTDKFVNSNAHIIMCGRAGYEYDMTTNEDGKKELEKTGIKMKAETEMGFEPSLLLHMEREMDIDTKKVVRIVHVLKDRSTKLDGRSFKNPTFATFKPHIEFLNLGGEQLGVDPSRTSIDMVEDPRSDFAFLARQKDIVLDEIETLLVEYYPSTSAKDRQMKIQLLKDAFGTASWERIKTFQLETLRAGFEGLGRVLSGAPPQIDPPAPEKVLGNGGVHPVVTEETIDAANTPKDVV